MHTLAERIAQWLAAEGNLPPEKRAVLAYGALTALNTCLAIALMLVAGGITGLTAVILWAAAVAGGFRLLTGGAHYSSPWRCSLSGAVTYLLLAFLAKITAALNWSPTPLGLTAAVAAAYGAWVILRHAPTDTKAYRLSDAKKARLRRLSLAALALGGLGWVAAMVLQADPLWLLAAEIAFVWQMFSVTPTGFTFVTGTDLLLRRLGIGGEAR